jgi:hypothetical protein
MTTKQVEQSQWTDDKSAYVLPTGERVRVANGHMLWISRNTAQQRVQARIVKERER